MNGLEDKRRERELSLSAFPGTVCFMKCVIGVSDCLLHFFLTLWSQLQELPATRLSTLPSPPPPPCPSQCFFQSPITLFLISQKASLPFFKKYFCLLYFFCKLLGFLILFCKTKNLLCHVYVFILPCLLSLYLYIWFIFVCWLWFCLCLFIISLSLSLVIGLCSCLLSLSFVIAFIICFWLYCVFHLFVSSLPLFIILIPLRH
jgi:hypothetical protein